MLPLCPSSVQSLQISSLHRLGRHGGIWRDLALYYSRAAALEISNGRLINYFYRDLLFLIELCAKRQLLQALEGSSTKSNSQV